MATLFNTKISQTYQGLFKTIDNAILTAALKELTDGSGNQSGLFLNTAGDFKVTAILEWGSLKDTGTGVTITRFVTSTDGIENYNNNTSLPTSAAVKLYVDTKFAITDTLTEVLGFGNTTSGKDIAVSAGDDITFTDSSKALFGNSQDLEVNHDGNDSFITDLGTGNLRLRSDDSVRIQASTGGNTLATFTKGAAVDLYYNNSKKFETTNTGLSVTGVISNVTDPVAAQDAATKSYVDALDAGSDLDITDGTTAGAVNLNTQVLSILGTTNEIDSVVSGQSVTIGLPTSISTNLVGDVTGNLTGNVQGNLTGTVTATSVLADGVTATTQASSDDSTKVATTAYVKGLDNASDLDFSGTTGTGDVNLNTQTFAISGTANQITTAALNQGLQISLLSTGVTMPDGSIATTQSAGNDSTKIATTAYVDTSAALYLPLLGGIMSGNTIHNDSVKSLYGTGSDAEIYHDGTDFYANNSTGQFNIGQGAVTESIVFKTSNNFALDTTALTISRNGDLTTGRDVTIAGDLTVNGTTTTVNSQTLSVVDPLIQLAKGNTANSLDIGLYGDYNDGTGRYLGLFSDASDGNKFKLFKGTTVEPTTTVNIGGAGYVAADLQVAGLEATTGTFTGAITLIDGSTTTTSLNFTGDPNTGIYQPADNLIGFVSNGSRKILVDSAGVTVQNGNLFLNADSTSSSLNRIILGAGSDLQIYHDGSDSYINESGSGQLKIGASQILLYNAAFSGFLARFVDGGESELYFNTVKRFETTNTGAFVTGNLGATDGNFTGNITVPNGLISTIAGNNLTISGSVALHAGLTFATNAILPVTVSVDNDNVVDLGQSNNQFKNLYLGSEIISGGGATFAGNVAINSSLLSITNDAGIAGIGIRAKSDNICYIDFGDSADSNIGGINYSNINDTLNFRTGNSNKVTIDSSGNVLMGNTVVNPASGFSDQAGIGLKYSTTVPELQVSSDSIAMELGRTSTGGDGDILALRKAGTVVHTFQTNNVSIGTNATFAGNIASTATSFLMNFAVTDNSTFFSIDHTGNENWVFKCESIGGSNDFLTIGATGGGLVGFGDTANLLLDSKSTSSATTELNKIIFRKLHPSGASSGYYDQASIRAKTFGGYSGGLNFYTNKSLGAGSYGETLAMSINNVQNIGIGTDSPNAKTNIENGHLLISQTPNTTQENILLQGAGYHIGSTLYGNVSIRSSYDNSANSGTLNFYTAASGIGTAERMNIDSSGLVKINPGTTNNTSYDALVLTGGANSTSGSGAKMYLSGTVNDPISRGTIIEGLMTDNANAHAIVFSTSGASAAPTEKMRIQADGDINITGGGRILSSAGIYLGSNNNTNLLSQYKEDSWSPVITYDTETTAPTYVSGFPIGKYTRIGNQVTVYFVIYLSNKGAGSGALRIGGLPFTVNNTFGSGEPAAVHFTNVSNLATAVVFLGGWANNASTYLQVRMSTGAATTFPAAYCNIGDINNNLYMQGCCTYMI